MISITDNTVIIQNEKLTGVDVRGTDIQVIIEDCDFTE